MNVLTIESEAFQTLIKKIEKLQTTTSDFSSPSPIKWINNERFCEAMGISKRSAQNYRDQGVIPYSVIRGKVYYRISDIEELLERGFSKTSKK